MNIDKPENPYTCPLAAPYPTDPPPCGATSMDRHSGSFSVSQLHKLLDYKTQYLMAVPHDGPRISEGERTLLERDLASATSLLKTPYDLLSVIKLLSAIEHVLTTLVMDNPSQYSMSQLWGIASKYMGQKLYLRNVDIRRNHTNWIAMRRAATKEIAFGRYMLAYGLFDSVSPDDFDTLHDYLETLAWATADNESSWSVVGIYHIISKLGQVLGNGGLLENVGDALSGEDPAAELERCRLEVDGLWQKKSGGKKRRK